MQTETEPVAKAKPVSDGGFLDNLGRLLFVSAKWANALDKRAWQRARIDS